MDTLEQDIETPEQANEILTELARDVAEPAGDISIAIERLRDPTEPFVLPFYEEDRQRAFTIGMAVGAVLQERENVTE